MTQRIEWAGIDAAPRDGLPFWIGTESGGVLLEAWHWCSEENDYAGVITGTTLKELRSAAPLETFYYAKMHAPKRQRH
jgi:hypothetical protein